MKKILIAALAVTCFTGIANADETPPAAASVAPPSASDSLKTSAASPGGPVDNVSQSSQAPSTFDQLKDKLELSYFGDYRGGNAGNYGSGLQPDSNGIQDDTSPQGLESYVTTGIKPAKDWMVGVTTHFFDNEADSAGPKGQSVGSFEMMNPSFVITKKNLITANGFALKGYLYSQVPVSSYDYISQPGHNMVTTIQPTINMTYDIKGTRWTLGTYAYYIDYVAGSDTPDGLRTYKLYVAPYVNYQITPTVAGTVWVDLIQATRAQGTGFIAGMSNPTADIEPGVNWDVIPGNLSLNPMLNIYPGHATLASTSLQMVIIGRVF